MDNPTEEEIRELTKKSKDYADSQEGLKLNPDGNIVKAIVKGLLMNKRKEGEIYCPCRIISGDKGEDSKNICPCVYHKDEVRDTGHCKCLLFVRE